MGYISQDRLRELLGNTSDVNVSDELLDEADQFVNGTINSKTGVVIPPGNIHYGKAVGIAYMLGKVFAQFGDQTEAQRSLDFKIAMDLLNDLYTDMVATGALNLLLETDTATIDDTSSADEYLTAPLNPRGITVIGTSRNIMSVRKNALDVFTEIP